MMLTRWQEGFHVLFRNIVIILNFVLKQAYE